MTNPHPVSSSSALGQTPPAAPPSDNSGSVPGSPGAPAPTPSPPPLFPRSPGETPRAFGAFMAFFQLGPARSLAAVADQLGEGLPTVKNWSSKHGWSARLMAFNAGLLQQQALTEAAVHCRHAADWAARLQHFREQEWDAAQKLIAAVQCFLESFGEEDLRRMNLAQVSRALQVSSAVARLALAGAELPPSADPALSPVQQQLLAAARRLYAQPAPDRDAAPVSGPKPDDTN